MLDSSSSRSKRQSRLSWSGQPTGRACAARTLPAHGGQVGSGQDHLVAGLEQRLADQIHRMNPAGRHHHFVGVADGDAVGAAQLGGEEIQQAGNAGRLEVVALVLVDGAAHRRLDRLGRVEADVALIEPERVVDRIHHVADADDAGERDDVEVFAHLPGAANLFNPNSQGIP